jgi:Na+/H+-dicarboxylate symporter
MERERFPLWQRVLIAVTLGIALGLGAREWFGGQVLPFLTAQQLGDLGLLIIRLLRTMAVPLIFFAVIDALVRTTISGKSGLRLIAICLVNVSVALTIGLVLVNVFHPGLAWKDHLAELVAQAPPRAVGSAAGATLDPVKNVAAFVPANVVDPFYKDNGNVIMVVLMALLIGGALRQLIGRDGPDSTAALLGRAANGGFEVFARVLQFIVQAIPYAVFAVLTSVVAREGLEIFSSLAVYVVAMAAGLVIHAGAYYTFAALWIGGKSPRVYWGEGKDALVAAMSMNSSLATVPLTLQSLKRMKVSDESARLSACVGTNLNNDGIILYDAMAAIFLAQACGYDLSLGQQLMIAAASIMAGIGISGIPDAGLIVLPLVLATVGLPDSVVIGVIPLLFSVDWLIGRFRSGVNVMSDMVVAVMLDGRGRTSPGSSAA